MNDVPANQAALSDRSGMVTVVYILYLVGLVTAYVNRSGAPDWAQSHRGPRIAQTGAFQRIRVHTEITENHGSFFMRFAWTA
jgi:hypothetical protein